MYVPEAPQGREDGCVLHRFLKLRSVWAGIVCCLVLSSYAYALAPWHDRGTIKGLADGASTDEAIVRRLVSVNPEGLASTPAKRFGMGKRLSARF